MKLKEIASEYPYLDAVVKTYPESMVLVDTEKGLALIEELGKDHAIHIHCDFRVRNVTLMKGYSGEYDEQEEKLNSGQPHESEFWMYHEETVRYRKEQVIRTEKAIIF
jgi:hypothetical protein